MSNWDTEKDGNTLTLNEVLVNTVPVEQLSGGGNSVDLLDAVPAMVEISISTTTLTTTAGSVISHATATGTPFTITREGWYRFHCPLIIGDCLLATTVDNSTQISVKLTQLISPFTLNISGDMKCNRGLDVFYTSLSCVFYGYVDAVYTPYFTFTEQGPIPAMYSEGASCEIHGYYVEPICSLTEKIGISKFVLTA